MLYRSITATAALALAASTSVVAQDISLAIAESLTQFEAQDLIPDPIDDDDIELSAALTLAFDSTNVTTGQRFEFPADTSALAAAPIFQLDVPASLAAQYAETSFTAMIVDPGAFGQTLGGSNVTRHYLANDLRLTDGQLTNSTAAITPYAAPGPAAGTGAHRYIALVFAQQNNFEPPSGFTTEMGVSTMDLEDYIDDAENLGDIVAMTYIMVENTEQGTATVSSSTAVASSSVAAAQSSIASSLTLTTSATSGGAGGAGGGSATSEAATPTASAGTSGAVGAAAFGGSSAALAAMLGMAGVAFGAWVM